MLDVFRTQGAFSWAELATPDPQAAAAFYSALLGWQFESSGSEPGAYRVIKAGDVPVGGLMQVAADRPGSAASWGCYVTVRDIEHVVQRCVDLGGRVLMPATEVLTVGRMAVLQDPQGAVFNAICYDDATVPSG